MCELSRPHSVYRGFSGNAETKLLSLTQKESIWPPKLQAAILGLGMEPALRWSWHRKMERSQVFWISLRHWIKPHLKQPYLWIFQLCELINILYCIISFQPGYNMNVSISVKGLCCQKQPLGCFLLQVMMTVLFVKLMGQTAAEFYIGKAFPNAVENRMSLDVGQGISVWDPSENILLAMGC